MTKPQIRKTFEQWNTVPADRKARISAVYNPIAGGKLHTHECLWLIDAAIQEAEQRGAARTRKEVLLALEQAIDDARRDPLAPTGAPDAIAGLVGFSAALRKYDEFIRARAKQTETA